MNIRPDKKWQRGWRVRSLLWGWTCSAMPMLLTCVAAMLLAPWSVAAAVCICVLALCELLLAFTLATQPLIATGSTWADDDIDALKRALSVRAEVRWAQGRDKPTGGSCRQRYGRDLVVIDVDRFSNDQALAVAAHEFGHTKQSPLAAPLLEAGARIAVGAVWLWALRGDGWQQGMITGGVGVLMWIAAILIRTDTLRLGAVSVGCIYLAWMDLCAGVVVCVAWVLWRLLAAMCDRVHERLADEAVRVIPHGDALLNEALRRLGGRDLPWWRQAFMSHPPVSTRGAGR